MMIFLIAFSLFEYLGDQPTADMLDIASKAGTLSMQALLLCAMIILGLALRYMHNENKRTIKEYSERMDLKDLSMSKERIDRINMLMDLLREDAKVKADLTHAVANNTAALNELKQMVNRVCEILAVRSNQP